MDYITELGKYKRKILINDDIEELIEFKVQEIKRNNQTHGRNDNSLRNHVSRGLCSELAAADIFECDLNSVQTFDYTNPHTFAYDLISKKNGKHIEVKTLHENNSGMGWLNVNMNGDKKQGVDYGVYPDVQTAVKNSQYIDYIIFVENVNNVVTVKYIFDMNDFKSNLRMSKRTLPKSNSTHYLDPSRINILK